MSSVLVSAALPASAPSSRHAIPAINTAHCYGLIVCGDRMVILAQPPLCLEPLYLGGQGALQHRGKIDAQLFCLG